MWTRPSTARNTGLNSTRGFVFYDPYYEELLRRKRERDECIAKNQFMRKCETQATTPECNKSHEMEAARVSSPLNNNSSSYHDQRGVASKDNTLHLSSLEEPGSSTVEQMARAMRSLYAESDRHKLRLTESMQRESRANRELVRLRKKLKSEDRSEFVPVEEFRDLEAKYLNALKLVDDLNWRLNQLPPR